MDRTCCGRSAAQAAGSAGAHDWQRSVQLGRARCPGHRCHVLPCPGKRAAGLLGAHQGGPEAVWSRPAGHAPPAGRRPSGSRRRWLGPRRTCGAPAQRYRRIMALMVRRPLRQMRGGAMAGEARWAGEDQLLGKAGAAARRDEGSVAGSDERPTQPSTHLCRSQWRFKDPKSPPASTVALTAGGAAWGRGGSKTQRHTCCRGTKPTAGGRRTIAAVQSGAHLQVRRRHGGFRPG